jgi:N-methylhydantoinase A
VGSGGGSIAWTDPYGYLKVGPQSAGADPGPICYGKGGTKPTVTDAAIVLGRLPTALIGGEIKLDLASAKQAYEDLARKFEVSAEEVAAGALEVAAANQVFGIRQVTTSRGREPGKYAMVAFGGAGGLFATEVADFLDIRTIISPPNPGNLCALGLQVSDVRRDYIRTLVRQQSKANAEEILSAWNELARTGADDIRAEGIPEDKIRIYFSADVRYFGEGHEVPVNIPPALSGVEALAYMWKRFHGVHDETFGFNYEGEQDVELVNLRVQAVGEQHRPRIERNEVGGKLAKPFGRREVYWRKAGWTSCPLYRRTELTVRQQIDGPAIIEEYGSTVVVPRSWSLVPDEYQNLILEKAA